MAVQGETVVVQPAHQLVLTLADLPAGFRLGEEMRPAIDPKAVLFLVGSEIDYEVSKLSAKFVFHNPNETDACGCGESVTIQPAKLD